MLQAIIFDFDGIIVDSEPIHFQATQRVLSSLGLDLDFPTYLQECVGQPDYNNFQRIALKHQLDPNEQPVQSLVAAKVGYFRELLQTVKPCPGVIPLIKTAATQFPLGICSGSFKNEINRLLSSLNNEDLSHFFKCMVTIEDVPAGKPDPAGYRLAAKQLGVLPEFCLAIEDSPAGIIAAKAAGMSVLAVTTTHPREKLSLADRCVDSLAQVTLPDLNQIAFAKV